MILILGMRMVPGACPTVITFNFIEGDGLVGVEWGASLNFQNTTKLDASISNFFVFMWTYFAAYGGNEYSYAHSFEVLLHFCVNTYNASVTSNIASVNQIASYTEYGAGVADTGSIWSDGIFQTNLNDPKNYSATYLMSPDAPGQTFIVGDSSSANTSSIIQLSSLLENMMGGIYTNAQNASFNGLSAWFNAVWSVLDEGAGVTSMWTVTRNISENTAMSLTNA